jgi:hypothetical protein
MGAWAVLGRWPVTLAGAVLLLVGVVVAWLVVGADQQQRAADRHFTVRRIAGRGNLWISECLITYDGQPAHSVSIMEFASGLVAHETQYFADPFPAAPWRASLTEPAPGQIPGGP